MNQIKDAGQCTATNSFYKYLKTIVLGNLKDQGGHAVRVYLSLP